MQLQILINGLNLNFPIFSKSIIFIPNHQVTNFMSHSLRIKWLKYLHINFLFSY
jgi:hypothetical protein